MANSNLQKTEVLRLRCTPSVRNRIATLAQIYADGNVSAWLEHSALNAPRRFLSEAARSAAVRPAPKRRRTGRKKRKGPARK